MISKKSAAEVDVAVHRRRRRRRCWQGDGDSFYGYHRRNMRKIRISGLIVTMIILIVTDFSQRAAW